MLRQVISHARLMRESTDRIETAAKSANRDERIVAQRILESSHAWSKWEGQHSVLMRGLAAHRIPEAQVAALKHASFRLLHGKALFQYLCHSGIRGEQRRRVMAHFRPGRDYDAAVVDEHAVYLRKACSHLCTSHLGGTVALDPAFLDPMQRYEELYREYFGVYCLSLLDCPGAEERAQTALLSLLKQQLGEYRWAIQDPRRAQPWLRREAELRLPTGDTQRLATLARRTKRRP